MTPPPSQHGSPSGSTSGAQTSRSQRVLVVEDEEALALGIRDALLHAGHTVKVAHDGRKALELARSGEFDLLVLDLMLPGMNGLDVLRALDALEVALAPEQRLQGAARLS